MARDSAAKAKGNRIFRYVKNVGRSFGYIALSTAADQNDFIADMVKQNKDMAQSIYTAIKDYKGTFKKGAEWVKGTGAIDVGKEAVSNVLEDIKNGTWYNPERIDRITGEAMGLEDDSGDFDDTDFNFDDDSGSSGGGDDWDFDSFDENESERNLATRNTIVNTGSEVSKAVGMATATSAKYVASVNTRNTNVLVKQNGMIFDQMTLGFKSLNENLTTFAQIAQPLTQHMQNASLFYTNTSEALNKQTELLQKLVDNTTPKPPTRKSSSSRSQNTLNDFIDPTTGAIDIQNYGAYVLKNINNVIEENFGMLGAFDMNGGKSKNSAIRMLLASPISSAMKLVVENIIPESFKQATQTFNQALAGTFAHALGRIGNLENSDNPILSFLGSVLGVRNGITRRPNPGNYEKGKVDFDGITRMAITKVIPTYLSKILSAMTGGEESMFDYNTGKFTNRKSVQKAYFNMIQGNANNASWDIKDAFDEYMDKKGVPTGVDTQRLNKQMDAYFRQSVLKDKDINPLKLARKNENEAFKELKKMGFTNKEDAKFFITMMREVGDNNPVLMMSYLTAMTSARTSISQFNKNIDADDALMSLFNDSGIVYSKNSKVSRQLSSAEKNAQLSTDAMLTIKSIPSYLEAIIKLMANGNNNGGGIAGLFRRNNKPATSADEIISNIRAESNNSREEYSQNNINNLQEKVISGDIKHGDIPNLSEETFKAYKKYYSPDDQKKLQQNYDKLFGPNATINDQTAKARKKFILQLEKDDRARRRSSNKSDFERMFGDTEAGQAISGVFGQMQDFLKKPFGFLEEQLAKADKAMYNFVFNDMDEAENSGFLNFIVDKTKKIFSDFGKWMKDTFYNPVKQWFKDHGINKFSDVFDKIGAYLGIDTEGVRDKFKEVGQGVKQGFKNVGNWISDSFTSVLGGFATGGYVPETGIATLHKGEFVVPAKYNPFYHGSVPSISQQIREERDAFGLNKWIGHYAGGNVPNISELVKALDEGTITKDEIRKQYGNEVLKKVKKERGKNSRQYKRIQTTRKIFDSIGNAVKGAGNFGKEFLKGIIPGDEDHKKEADKIADTIKETTKEVTKSDNLSSMITGGLVGGGISLLTGGIVSPLLGAAAGAGLGLTLKSKKVQHVLFGDMDDEGNYSGGLFNPEVSKFLNKQFPDIAKYTTVGGAAGILLPGGPIFGAVAGSLVGIAKKTTLFDNFLFGDEGLLGKSKEEVESTLKQKLPAMGLGTIAGLVAGPFGPLLNIAIGGVAGYAVTSNKFADFILGKADENGKRKGGITDIIRDKVVTPLVDTSKVLVQEVKFRAKQVGKFIINTVKDIADKFKDRKKGPLGQILAKWIPKVAGGVFKGALNIATLPTQLIGAAGRQLRTEQIARGRASDMTAAERIQWRKTHAKNFVNQGPSNIKNSRFDQMLADKSMNKETLERLQLYLGSDKDRENLDEDSKEEIRKLAASYGFDIDKASGGDKRRKAWKYQDMVKRELKALNNGERKAMSPEEMQLDKQTSIMGKILIAVQKIAGIPTDPGLRKEMGETQETINGPEGPNSFVMDATGLKRTVDTPDGPMEVDKDGKPVDGSTMNKILERIKATKNKAFETINQHLPMLSSIGGLFDKFGKFFMGDKEKNKEGILSKLFGWMGKGLSSIFRKGGKVLKGFWDLLKSGMGISLGNILAGLGTFVLGKILIDKKSAKKANQAAYDISNKITGNQNDEYNPISNKWSDNIGAVDAEGYDKNGNLVTNYKNDHTVKSQGGYADNTQLGTTYALTWKDADGNPVAHQVRVDANGNPIKKGGYYIDLNGYPIKDAPKNAKLVIADSDATKTFSERLWDNTIRGGIHNAALTAKSGGIIQHGQSLIGTLAEHTIPKKFREGIVGTKTYKQVAGDIATSAKNKASTITDAFGTVGNWAKGKAASTADWMKNTRFGKMFQPGGRFGKPIKVSVTPDHVVDKFGNDIVDLTNDGAESATKYALATQDDIMKMTGHTIGESIDDGIEDAVTRSVKSVVPEVAQDTAEAATKGVATGLVTQIDDMVDDCGKALTKVPWLKGMGNAISNMMTDMKSAIAKKLKSMGQKAIAVLSSDVAKKALIVLDVAMTIVDFAEGMQDARSAFGITEKPSMGQRLVSGILRAVLGRIPFIGALIPTNLLINIFCKWIAPALGIDVSDLTRAQTAAKEEVAAYNEEHNTNYSVQEYNKQVLHDYTLGERVTNGVKSGYKKVKNVVGTTAKGVANVAKGAFNTVKGLATGEVSIQNVMKSGADFLGNLKDAIGEKFSYVAKGDIKGLWTNVGENLNDETDYFRYVKTLMSGMASISLTPITAVSWVGHKVFDGVKSIFTAAAKLATNVFAVTKDNASYAFKGDLKGLWANNLESDEENPMGIFEKIIGGMQNVYYTPFTAVSWVGHKVFDFFKGIVDKVRGVGETLAQSHAQGEAIFADKNSELKDLMTVNITDDEGNPVGGLVKGMAVADRLGIFVAKIVQFIGLKVKGWFDNAIVNPAKNLGTMIGNTSMKNADAVKNGSVAQLWSNDIGTTVSDDWTGPIWGIVGFIENVFLTIPAAAVAVGKKVKGWFDTNVAAPAKNLGTMIGNTSMKNADAVKNGSVAQLWSNDIGTTVSDDWTGPIWGIVGFIENVFLTIPAAAVAVGKKVKGWFDTNVAAPAKNLGTMIADTSSLNVEAMKNGSLSELWSNDIGKEVSDDWTGPIWGIVGFVENLALSIPTLAVGAGKKIKEKFESFVDKIKGTADIINTVAEDNAEYAKNGDLKGLWDNENTKVDEEGNPLGAFGTVVNFMSNLSYSGPALFNAAGNKIKSGFSSIVDKTKDAFSGFGDAMDKLREASDDGDPSGVNDVEFKSEEGGFMGGVAGIIFSISQKMYYLRAWLNKLGKGIKGLAEDAKENITEFGNNVKEKAGQAKDWAGDKLNSAKNWVGDRASDLYNWIQGGGSGFVSQGNPRYANVPYGGSTLAEDGCGPAVASMITGKSIKYTSAYARNRGYENGAGTSADYFGDVLSNSGLNPQYIYVGGGSNPKQEIAANIAAGNPTVLLGQNYSNTSKANSPFGSGNHYVLASGMDNNGNIIVQDPELNKPNALYSQSILNDVKLGIPTGGGSAIGRAFRRLTGGTASNEKYIWDYLRKAGFTEAQTAGIMGNFQKESGNNPASVEGDYLKQYPGYNAVFGNLPTSAQNYMNNILFPIYKRQNIVSDSARKWYLVTYDDGKQYYFPGVGLAGFTGGVLGNLMKYAKSKGQDWKSLEAQLGYTVNDYNSAKRSYTRAAMAQATTPSEAAANWFDYYERGNAPGDHNKLSLAKIWRGRDSFAQQFYNKYKGSQQTTNIANYVPASTDIKQGTGVSGDSSGATSTSSGITSLGGMFSSLLGSWFGSDIANAFGFGNSSSTSSGGVSTTGSYTGSIDTSSVPADVAMLAKNIATGKGNTKQKALAQKMMGLTGKLTYSMSGPRNPAAGSADCSSTVNWVYKQVTGKDIGNNTGSIINSSNTEWIDLANGIDKKLGGTHGSGPTLSRLMPGDIMLYSRPDGSYNIGRPYRVGHVEMFIGDGKREGHGGGTGPKISAYNSDSGSYIGAKRLKGIAIAEQSIANDTTKVASKNTNTTLTAMGSGLLKGTPRTLPSYNQVLSGGASNIKYSGSNARVVDLSKMNSRQKKRVMQQMVSRMNGGASNIAGTGVNNDTMSLLMNISQNSDSIVQIVQLLGKMAELIAASGQATANAAASSGSSDTETVGSDPSFQQMFEVLNSLASGN